MKGLKIRSPGGAGISWRISFFGGIPNTTAWPNVPLALSQGTFDGFVSTNESCATAKLWEAGVRYSYQDHQYVGQYMPMMSDAFWAKLTADQQKLMIDLWAANIGDLPRQRAGRRRTRARKTMEENGVQLHRSVRGRSWLRRAKAAAGGCRHADRRDAKLSPEVVRWPKTSVNGTGLSVAVRARYDLGHDRADAGRAAGRAGHDRRRWCRSSAATSFPAWRFPGPRR